MTREWDEVRLHTARASLPRALEYAKNVTVCTMGSEWIVPLLAAYQFKEIRVVAQTANVRSTLKGADVVLGGCGVSAQIEVASAASELGMPFITYPVITTLVPDGITFDELEFPPAAQKDIISETLIRTLQVIELMKLVTGLGEPFFPPRAVELLFDPLRLEFRVKKIRLKVRFKGGPLLSSCPL